MCDFHSVVVSREGEIAHVASNSHSEAVAAAGWAENTVTSDLHSKNRFIECEWDGFGNIPSFEKIAKNLTDDYTESQKIQTINHYTKLSEFLNGDIKHLDYFSGNNYVDVRRCVAQNTSTSQEILANLSTDENIWVRRGVAL